MGVSFVLSVAVLVKEYVAQQSLLASSSLSITYRLIQYTVSFFDELFRLLFNPLACISN